MKTLTKAALVLLLVLFFLQGFAQNARIKIDPVRTIGEISPLLYGNFVEHLSRCVYGENTVNAKGQKLPVNFLLIHLLY